MSVFESISSYNFVVVNGYAYFSNLFYNALFKVELKTGKTFFLGNFKDEELAENNLHLEVVLKENQIYFFPRRGRHIYIYQLSTEAMQAIEIRKKTENFFVIEEVVIQNNYIFFLPKQNNGSIKKLERNTFKVTNVSNKLIIQGKYLSKDRHIIPTEIVEKYHIQHGGPISCKQMSDGKWYCFMPIGRQLLRFTDGTQNLEFIPLTIVNEIELQRYLCKVKQEVFKVRLSFDENDGFKVKAYIEVTKLSRAFKGKDYRIENKYVMGEKIWKVMKE